jgi:ribonuclease P protein component
MIVGKRQLKRSVDRNQVKRALRESFRIQRASLPSVDIVIQLAEAPPKESISEQATATWPRVVSAIGTTNDQQSR